jgi:hypothetical protein
VRLAELAAQLTAGLVTLSGVLPTQLLDACRFGARACVSLEDATGAAGAIADVAGGVRPCTRGAVIGRVDERMATILETERRLWEEARVRRGCQGCSARAVCSRCLFPAPFADEAAYCEWMRAQAPAVPALMRLFEALGYLNRVGPPPRRVRVKTGRTAALVAARGRPWPVPASDDSRAQTVAELAARWRERETWIAALDEQRFVLLTRRDGVQQGAPVTRATAALGELIADGASAAELDGWARTQLYDAPAWSAAWSALVEQLS